MVAAEAAAAGTPPLVARHSGLAEVAEAIEAEYPPERRGLVSFENGDVDDLTDKLRALLELSADDRQTLGTAAREAVAERFSWAAVGRRLLEPLV
jgi:glycosyltransferase involved in cell wall biosynthesis